MKKLIAFILLGIIMLSCGTTHKQKRNLNETIRNFNR